MSTDLTVTVPTADDEPHRLIELGFEDCISLLAACDIGRIGVILDGQPMVLPISYRLATIDNLPIVAIRTRPGSSIDQVDQPVCFEIDGVDPGHDGGWSVIVLGTLVAVAPDVHFDPHPLLPDHRDAWRVIVPTSISGRRLAVAPVRWTFDPHGYL